MPSAALIEWQLHRCGRIEELFAAHAEITGRGRALRRTQLNWALTMRIAAEFQGYARSLHDLAVDQIAQSTARVSPDIADVVRTTLTAGRRLDRGNPGPAALDHDFDLFGMNVWQEIEDRYPGRGSVAKGNLQTLLEARNAIAHADDRKLSGIEARGYSLADTNTVGDWHRRTGELCRMMDFCVAAYVARVTGGEPPW